MLEINHWVHGEHKNHEKKFFFHLQEAPEGGSSFGPFLGFQDHVSKMCLNFRFFLIKKCSDGLNLSKIYCSFENESKNRIFPDPFRRKKSGFGGSTRIENRVIHLRSFGDLFTPLAPAGIPVNFEWRHVSYYQTGEKRQLFF